MKFDTRESWLEAAIDLMKPLFEKHDYKVPKVRVSCGWPSSRGLSPRKRTLGECWDKSAASDKVAQIFISPYLEDVLDPQGVIPTLVHEVVHAVVGNENKHNKVFGKCARAIGLEGKLTATHAGEVLLVECDNWNKRLGKYPHVKLDLGRRPVKKQTTRMIKMECSDCGYVARTSKKWLDDVGPAHCPRHGEMTVEQKDE